MIGPRVMKGAIDMSMGAVLIAVLAGGQILGLAGIFIALPVAAAARTVIDELYLDERRDEVRRIEIRQRLRGLRGRARLAGLRRAVALSNSVHTGHTPASGQMRPSPLTFAPSSVISS